MTNQVALLNELTIDAKINLDDVVNVFISRYETDLTGRFETVQGQLKENAQCLKALDLEVLTRLKEDFVLENQVIHSCFTHRTTQSFNEVVINWPAKTACLTITHTTTPNNNCKLADYYAKTESKNSFSINVNLYGDAVSTYERLVGEGNKLREELMSYNQQLQQVDRKARQIKGLIAERKLEQAGMTDLLQNPELAQLIQLK